MLQAHADPKVPVSGPTRETYDELQWAYDHFNRTLFGGELPPCLITLQREKSTCGYFSAGRFARTDGTTTDEIAMNPAYFPVVPLVETLQTLVHEQCHLWQQHFGKPGRGRYHNEQWAAKMESIGLMPSSTGKPGGKRTGDMMADYAIEGGRFLQACADLLTDSFKISWYDRFPAEKHVRFGAQSMGQHLPAQVGGGAAPVRLDESLGAVIVDPGSSENIRPTNRSNRLKYTCSGDCKVNVWGKPELSIMCGRCQTPFIAK